MQDLIAERKFYDDLFGDKPDNEHIAEGYDELHEFALAEPPKGLVLDLGCGTGAHAVRIAARGHSVVAIDLTIGGVQRARRRFEEQELNGLFVVADAEHLPIKDNGISLAWTSLLLHHFPKLDLLPGEVTRITRDRIVAFEPNAHNLLTWFAFNIYNRFIGTPAMTRNQRALKPRKLQDIFTRYGFEVQRITFVDRRWPDGKLGLRSLYSALTKWLPLRHRANKFLISFCASK